jgi:RNA polymerase sigma factor (TIGR02999 family)
MEDLTDLLDAMERGDPNASDRLLPLVYDELRRLAALKLAQEKPGQTLQPTALLHEAYLRLVGKKVGPHWDNCGHFFAAAAEAMRRILVENARRKRRLKWGGNRQRVDLDEIQLVTEEPSEDLVSLSEALELLAKEDAQKAELVKLRFFAGLSIEESASCLGISRATAIRWWTYAKAWLYDQIKTASESVCEGKKSNK